MIDTRNYKTHEELVEAMEFERDCSELEYLNAKISEMNSRFELYKHQYENVLQRLNSKKARVAKRIDEYYKKQRETTSTITYPILFNRWIEP